VIDTRRPAVDLPTPWTMRSPRSDDVPALVELVTDHKRMVFGSGQADEEAVVGLVTGTGSWTRRQVLVEDGDGRLVAWASVHDRAAGRTMIDLTAAPDLGDADRVARALLRWIRESARQVAALREVEVTQLDAMVYADDERLRRWLAEDGYRHTRTWLQMSRPVLDADALPRPPGGTRVRRVARHEDGSPIAADLQVVHQMLEESFADHFNSYRESFPEFVQRLRESPGHRWDHWWIAEVDIAGDWRPGGALVGSVLTADDSGAEGSYVDYIGVHRDARGRGVAKALLHTVIRDAADRGRNRVDLEVDADSSTRADQIYLSMGWETKYRTESWHDDCRV
jgi:GNAT superfamily N-acetyltransferase